MARTENLYRIDDVLIRTGTGLGFLIALAVIGWTLLPLEVTRSVASALGLGALALVGLGLAPVALLAAGFHVRGREKNVLMLHSVLARQLELRVPDFLANTEFDRTSLDATLRELNESKLGYYVWDRDEDVIQDARLRRGELHYDRCDACHAALSVTIQIGTSDVPECPYCDACLDTGDLAQAKRRLIDDIRAQDCDAPANPAPGLPRGVHPDDARPEFSVGLFVIMLMLFWPLGVGYAVRFAYKHG